MTDHTKSAGEVEAREIARPPVTIERLLKVMKDVRDDLSARSSLSAEPETVELSQSIWNRLCHWCVEGDAYLTSTRSQDARVEEIRGRHEVFDNLPMPVVHWRGGVEIHKDRAYLLEREATLSARIKGLEEERDKLSKLVYVPGLWRCAKCEFTLVQRTLYTQSGTVGPRDEPGDKCPNCNSPLWRVTERDDRHEMIKRSEEMFHERQALQSDKDRLTKALARARTYVEMSYDENGGEEAAEAKHDLKEIDLALSPPSTSQSEGEG